MSIYDFTATRLDGGEQSLAEYRGQVLLIIVVVTMDFMAQVQNYMMSQQYESLLKKANFKSS